MKEFRSGKWLQWTVSIAIGFKMALPLLIFSHSRSLIFTAIIPIVLELDLNHQRVSNVR